MQTNAVIKARVLYVSQERILAARGGCMFESRDVGSTWYRLAMLPVNRGEHMLLASRLFCRLFRKGVHHVGVGNSCAVLIANRSLYCLDGGSIKLLGPIKGSRPLALCVANDAFYYGEYRSNTERSSVHIRKWQADEKKWEVVWRFDGIRHVHGVFHDPYERAIWVTTGDHDHEAGIWRTDDDFATLQKVTGGTQRFRAVQLLFDRDHIYFGSDAPDEKNHILRMNRDGKNVEQLAAVSSSVFYGCKVGEHFFFSTAVEPSRVNTTRYAEVWGSTDGVNWQMVCRFKKDIWPIKYFQYGQALFPSGPGDGKNLWLTPMATADDNKTFKYGVEALFNQKSCRTHGGEIKKSADNI